MKTLKLILKRTIQLFLSSLFFVFSLAFAAEPTSNLTLQEALRLAVSNHPSISGKKNEFAGAADNLEVNKWQRFPGLSVVTSAGQNSPLKSTTGVISTIRLEQPIWVGGKISNSIDSAQAKMLAAEQAVIETEQDVLIKTATAFTELMKLREKLLAGDESIEEHQRLLELIERKARSEVSAMNEVIFAKARLDQAKSERTITRAQATNARTELEQYIGRAVDQLKNTPAQLVMPEDEDKAIQMMTEYSPTLRKLSAQAKAAEADIGVAKANLWPQLTARSDQTYGGVAPGNTTYLALTYQPGNGLAVLSSTREAESRRDVALSSIETYRLQLINNLHSDWNQYQSQLQQIETLSNLAETTKGVYQSYLRQYAAGRKTWVEVLNARKEATQAKYSLADAEWGSLISGLKVQVATGLVTFDTLALGN